MYKPVFDVFLEPFVFSFFCVCVHQAWMKEQEFFWRNKTLRSVFCYEVGLENLIVKLNLSFYYEQQQQLLLLLISDLPRRASTETPRPKSGIFRIFKVRSLSVYAITIFGDNCSLLITLSDIAFLSENALHGGRQWHHRSARDSTIWPKKTKFVTISKSPPWW